MNTHRTDSPLSSTAPATAPPVANRLALGLVALLGYAAHAAWHLANDTPWDALWICHIAALMIGLGLIAGVAALNGAGFLCAMLGLPSWLLYLFSGEPLIPTSLLTHVAAPLVALLGIRLMGLPRRSAALAFGVVIALTLICIPLTPGEANVNLAHGPIAGLSLWTVRGPLHYALLFGQWAVGLFASQWVWRRIFGKPSWLRDA